MFDGLKNKLSQYISANMRLIQLNAVERGAKVLGFVSYGMLLMFLILPILLFMGLGLAEFFASWFSSRGWGYMAASGVFLLLFMVLLMMKKTLYQKLENLFINLLSNDTKPKQTPIAKTDADIRTSDSSAADDIVPQRDSKTPTNTVAQP